MAHMLTTVELDEIVEAYLDRLTDQLKALPLGRRQALVAEIRDHIDALRAETPVRDGADLEALLARVGSTDEIASAALEDSAVVVEDTPTSHRRRGPLVVAVIVVLLVLSLSAGLVASFTSFFGGGAPAPARSAILNPVQPVTVTVPNVVGTSQAQACAELAAARLECNVRTALTAVAPLGQVVSQQPTPGSRAPFGSQITLMVSQGPSSP
jgi:hypothetical protein